MRSKFPAMLSAAAFAVLSLVSNFVMAESKPLRIIVPYAAGGQADAMARYLAEAMQTSLQRPVIVDNRPGAGGLIGIKALQTAPADGDTVLFRDSAFVVAPLVQKAANYNALTDLKPLASVGRSDMFLMVSKDIPARTVPELIAYAKAHPGELTAANPGMSTGSQLASALLAKRAQLRIVHVPYKGVAETVSALVSGDAKMQINVLTDSLNGQVKNGNIRLLASTGTEVSTFTPGLPRVRDTVENFGFDGFFAFVTLPAAPQDKVDAIARSIESAMADPSMQQKFRLLTVYPHYRGPKEFAKDMQRQYDFYSQIVKELGIEPM